MVLQPFGRPLSAATKRFGSSVTLPQEVGKLGKVIREMRFLEWERERLFSLFLSSLISYIVYRSSAVSEAGNNIPLRAHKALSHLIVSRFSTLFFL